MNRRVAELWSRTGLHLWPDEVMLASFEVADLPRVLDAAGPALGAFAAVVVERDEVSLTIARHVWPSVERAIAPRAVAGPLRAITLDIALDLDVCGYLLPAAERLAAAGVSIVPQCAFQKDHLLVDASRADDAMAVLEALVRDARERNQHRERQ